MWVQRPLHLLCRVLGWVCRTWGRGVTGPLPGIWHFIGAWLVQYPSTRRLCAVSWVLYFLMARNLLSSEEELFDLPQERQES